MLKILTKIDRIILDKNLIIIFVFALIIRLLFFSFEKPWDESILYNKIIKMGTDQRGYHQLAVNLLEYNQLTFKKGTPPTALRTPAYPVFIASIYYIFGNQPWVVILFQIFLDSLSAVIIFLTLRRLVDVKVGFLSGLIYAFDPHLILHSNSYYSETMFLFFLSLFLYFISSFFINADSKLKSLIFSAIFLGFSALVKPASAYLPYLITIYILLIYKNNLLEKLKYSILFLLTYIVVISPWLIRNTIIYGQPFLSNSGEYNLLAINITPMEIPKRKLPQHIVEYQLRAEADSLMNTEGKKPVFDKSPNDSWEELVLKFDYNKTEYWKRVALNYIKNDPISFFQYYLIGIIHSLFNLGSKEFAYYLNFTEKPSTINLKTEQNFFRLIKRFFSEKSLTEVLLGIIIFLYLFITYLGGLLGLIKTKSIKYKNVLLLLLFIAIYFLLVAGAGGLARFKVPAIPFYLVFVGIGIARLSEWMKYLFHSKSTFISKL